MLRSLLCAAATVLAICPPNAHAEVFSLRERLGREWNNEFVSFATTTAPGDRWILQDGRGRRIPFQWIKSDDGSGDRIGLLTDLSPYATNTYHLLEGRSPLDEAATDLIVDREPHVIRMANHKIGLAIRTRPSNDGSGPIAAIKLASGKWVCGSKIESAYPIAHWHVELTDHGPVFVEAVVRITFTDLGTWESRYRIYSGEPVILVDERFRVINEATFKLQLDRDYKADSLLYRYGRSMGRDKVGKNATTPIERGIVHQMEPWLHWWEAERRGPQFAVYGQSESELLSVAARHAGVWVDPAIPPQQQAPPLIKLIKNDGGLHADFPIAVGARSWMLSCHARDATLQVVRDPDSISDSSIAYRYLIKHGHFPLNTIKDYVLTWDSSAAHPRMLITVAETKRFRERNQGNESWVKKADYFVNNPATLTEYTLDDAVPAFLATSDDRLGTRLAAMTVERIDQWVDSLLEQNGMPLGAAPHQKSTTASAIALADLLYDSKLFSNQQRQHLSAKLAFLGYTFARPEYWSAQRGFAANPNMTTTVDGYRCAIASFLADHPKAKAWARDALGNLGRQLHDWSDAEGGWLEAPHYAVVSYDQILGAFVMAHNAGLSDSLYKDPKLKLVARWLAQINTPPDSRIGGYRHHPAIGHTYVNEPCGDFGLLACLFRTHDPDFSAEMQWQFAQNNMYASAGIGGFYPAFAGFRQLLSDPDLPIKAPSYQSKLFTKTGVVLRDHYPSQRETYLHMILGQHRDHYDDDSGSIVLYGKGRVLIDEFGYTGAAPASDHSMIECADIGSSVMEPIEFQTSPRFDYVQGRKQNWMRQVVMVKGLSSQEPTYFVIRDVVRSSQPLSWRAWFTASQIRISEKMAVVDGQEDVDMDVFFLSPQKLHLHSEEKSRTSGSGMYPNWTWKGISTTQIGLVAESKAEGNGHVHRISVVLFPRLETTARPKCTTLVGGQGVRVDHDWGSDFVFLSDSPFAYQGQEIEFEGQVGMVQLRRGEVTLKLAGGGSISAHGQKLQQ